MKRSVREQPKHEQLRHYNQNNTATGIIFSLSLVANDDSCSSVYTTVLDSKQILEHGLQEMEKSWDSGGIKAILGQTYLIWIKFVFEGKVTYQKPCSSHNCFIAHSHFQSGLKRKIHLRGGTHSCAYTATSRDWSLTASPNDMGWFTSTLFCMNFSDASLWFGQNFFPRRCLLAVLQNVYFHACIFSWKGLKWYEDFCCHLQD